MLEAIIWFAYRDQRVSLPKIFKNPSIVLKNHAVICAICALAFFLEADFTELSKNEHGKLTWIKFLLEFICALWFTRFLISKAELQTSCLANAKSEEHSLVRYFDSKM